MPFTPSLEALKALAHPRRLRVLDQLARHGPATSARLARDLGLNTGATSYHLRALAAHGFVEETDPAAGPDPAHPRERWWRAVAQDLRLPPRGEQDPETRAVVDEMNRLAYVSDLRLFAQRQGADEESGPWRDAFPYSRGTVRLTPEELRQLFDDYVALLNRYRRPEDETPAGARTVLTRFLAFPAPERPPEADAPPDADGPPAAEGPAGPDAAR
ncbi:helix-turn-helix domain-containing protein [Streptomyces sp. 3MP-14]|uniref:Helix-turn-helix domain-containing protein n=1 Tax=Streptomyces mimosae TaxID=2586635 RepID=A0A5N6A7U7_9ACTN|nr:MULTISPECIES: helix-turn-helix domain-containing protein [Streptomyces]KAB8163790.1 helix-turn-helix domain-containing protein [Streptomyces mimosae]KAB8175233.1 helix-turn-helix domain-containing protein [Streptomyces sp. 3MP-14]